ncbi:expressed unknown protein [Seminavis robusta]|uniref:Uncharacterized protein n=1 Tax=Seminavis robusta TaxID=568900 RepID=A0A9N8HZ04_9STRA|nr:expressed unknown protein [Seminavis robusta]|eukprot:Sro3113_g344010.1 n/a (276) ;mRNA; r:3406-4233
MTAISKSSRILLFCMVLSLSLSKSFSFQAHGAKSFYPLARSGSVIASGFRTRPTIRQSSKSDYEESNDLPQEKQNEESSTSFWKALSNQLDNQQTKRPPIQVDDANLLFYDVLLLINLSVSVSYWVVHRMQLDHIALAFNEGSLLSILWIIAGLYNGIFLHSALEGHQPLYDGAANSNNNDDSTEEENAANSKKWWESLTQTDNLGGPAAAGLLALNTFINTLSLRLIVALVVAVVEHRPVFDDPLEQLIPLEATTGLVLMSTWRTIHSIYATRI